MVDSQTAQAIVEFCSQPGCPLCNLVQYSVERGIESFYYESILDPISRQQVRESLGLCREHARLALEGGLSDALGFAILYEDILGTVLKGIAEDSGSSKDSRKRIVRQVNQSKPCPACLQKEETEKRSIAVLVDSLHKREFAQAFQKSDGLCLPHFRMVLESISSRETVTILLEHQRGKIQNLKGELKVFINKNDYRFRDKAFGEERDSYRRAIDMVVGKTGYKPQ